MENCLRTYCCVCITRIFNDFWQFLVSHGSVETQFKKVWCASEKILKIILCIWQRYEESQSGTFFGDGVNVASLQSMCRLGVCVLCLSMFCCFCFMFINLCWLIFLCYFCEHCFIIITWRFANSAWIMEDLIWPYADYRDKYKSSQRPSRVFQDAVEKAEELFKSLSPEKVIYVFYCSSY